MKFSKTSEHAIRALIWMAAHQRERSSVRELSQALDIPYKYLGRLMPKLVRAGIADVQQGKGGGYYLARHAGQIYLYQIMDAIDGLESLGQCILGFENCSDTDPCPVHQFWGPIRDRYRDMLYEVSLDQLSKTGFTRA